MFVVLSGFDVAIGVIIGYKQLQLFIFDSHAFLLSLHNKKDVQKTFIWRCFRSLGSSKGGGIGGGEVSNCVVYPAMPKDKKYNHNKIS